MRPFMRGPKRNVLTGENEGYAIVTQVEGIDALVTGHQHRVNCTKSEWRSSDSTRIPRRLCG